ncbi:hypothetical protein DOTSEDRAFT_24105 [Dothistroma septosporum NZE10]|uniref:F-box domain-containing protein n=1 Tax=Dothistroma septosporum (strain NZE10 / CBS 128990) TaxID=675120 RepID=N1PKX0_DOTSN|nr:hypothetical protein DOTSEDRAFT_24105 [Dothistroma septosporum NZE10]
MTKTKAIPLFRLPRELRDQIYANVGGREVKFKLVLTSTSPLSDSSDTSKEYSYAACVSSAARTNLLLVSRAVNNEYTTEMHRRMDLNIRASEDEESFAAHGIQLDKKLRAHLAQIPSLQLTLDLTCKSPELFHQCTEKYMVARDVLVHTMTRLELVRDDAHIISLLGSDDSEVQRKVNEAFTGFLNTEVLRFLRQGRHSRTVKYEYHLFQHQKMYSLLRTPEPVKGMKEKYPLLFTAFDWGEMQDLMERHLVNKVVYEVTASSDPDALLGLDYRFVSAGTFALDGTMACFEYVVAHARERMREETFGDQSDRNDEDDDNDGDRDDENEESSDRDLKEYSEQDLRGDEEPEYRRDDE